MIIHCTPAEANIVVEGLYQEGVVVLATGCLAELRESAARLDREVSW